MRKLLALIALVFAAGQSQACDIAVSRVFMPSCAPAVSIQTFAQPVFQPVVVQSFAIQPVFQTFAVQSFAIQPVFVQQAFAVRSFNASCGGVRAFNFGARQNFSSRSSFSQRTVIRERSGGLFR